MQKRDKFKKSHTHAHYFENGWFIPSVMSTGPTQIPTAFEQDEAPPKIAVNPLLVIEEQCEKPEKPVFIDDVALKHPLPPNEPYKTELETKDTKDCKDSQEFSSPPMNINISGDTMDQVERTGSGKLKSIIKKTSQVTLDSSSGSASTTPRKRVRFLPLPGELKVETVVDDTQTPDLIAASTDVEPSILNSDMRLTKRTRCVSPPPPVGGHKVNPEEIVDLETIQEKTIKANQLLQALNEQLSLVVEGVIEQAAQIVTPDSEEMQKAEQLVSKLLGNVNANDLSVMGNVRPGNTEGPPRSFLPPPRKLRTNVTASSGQVETVSNLSDDDCYNAKHHEVHPIMVEDPEESKKVDEKCGDENEDVRIDWNNKNEFEVDSESELSLDESQTETESEVKRLEQAIDDGQRDYPIKQTPECHNLGTLMKNKKLEGNAGVFAWNFEKNSNKVVPKKREKPVWLPQKEEKKGFFARIVGFFTTMFGKRA